MFLLRAPDGPALAVPGSRSGGPGRGRGRDRTTPFSSASFPLVMVSQPGGMWLLASAHGKAPQEDSWRERTYFVWLSRLPQGRKPPNAGAPVLFS